MADPIDDGFAMPPEWAPHTRCFMAWPCHLGSFEDLEAARAAFVAVAHAIARFEPVVMVAKPEHADEAHRRCGESVQVLPLSIDESWTRDTGPTYLTDGRGGLAGVDWPFNNYGEIWPDYEQDELLASRLLDYSKARRYVAPIVLEGGAVHTDGAGTLLTTDNVVLNPNRNPGLTRMEAEEIFRAFLGAHRVIWLEHALEVDATDGHVDNLACFVRPGVVVALTAEDPDDPHHAPLAENLARLRKAEDAAGRPLEVVEIAQPGYAEHAGERICASYINFYIANGGVVLPVYDDPADRVAAETLSGLFPDRRVVSVDAREIIRGEGSIHCITQQEPLP